MIPCWKLNESSAALRMRMNNYTSTTYYNSSSSKSEGEDEWPDVKCAEQQPEFREYLQGLPWDYVIVFAVLFGCCLICVSLYAEEIVYIFIGRGHLLHPSSSSASSCSAPSSLSPSAVDFRHRAKWILAVYPTLSVTAFIALIIPRTSSLNDLVSAIYVSVIVYVFISMLIDCFGGAEKMLSCLRNQRITWAITPACCCCCCCPRPRLSSTSLQVLRSLVIQFALVRPFIGYLTAIVWANAYSSQFDYSRGSSYLSFVYLLSTLMAVWAFGMVYHLCRMALDDMAIRPKFLCLQFVLIICGIQLPIISTLVQTGVIPCDAQLTMDGVASRWHHMLVICEMLLLLSAAKWFYRQRPLTPNSVKVIPDIEVV